MIKDSLEPMLKETQNKIDYIHHSVIVLKELKKAGSSSSLTGLAASSNNTKNNNTTGGSSPSPCKGTSDKRTRSVPSYMQPTKSSSAPKNPHVKNKKKWASEWDLNAWEELPGYFTGAPRYIEPLGTSGWKDFHVLFKWKDLLRDTING